MAPPNALGKRVKGLQVKRPFILGTTARPFDPEANPRPDHVPADHTHSWQVFVKGLNDTDITYWLRRVQFKLHESIPNHVRMIEGETNKPFLVNETGWGEFEITLKFYFVPESGEKPQTYYHHLRLHPYGKTDSEKELSKGPKGEVRSWTYEELLFNEPYEAFYEVLTTGAHPKGHPMPPPLSAGGKGKGKGGKGGAQGGKPIPPLPDKNADAVWERSALIPKTTKPGQPFSSETEELERKILQTALAKVQGMTNAMLNEVKEKEAMLKKLKEENAAAVAAGKTAKAGES